MKILGLAGYARSGKDTAGNALAELGWKRIAFADTLREFSYRLNPLMMSDESGKVTPLRWIIDEYGWNGYKRTQWAESIREHLQVLGTECGRELIGDTIWVDATFKNLDPDGKYVISDVRFPNEVEAIWQRGGCVLRVWRPGIEPANSHPSESALDDYCLDGVLENLSTADKFERTVRSQITKYFD